ncbi:MAG: hypothetical protein NUV46_02970 [Nanoarchaeota archaeon]|nr:hypothetical protein [Nanoarchaeota archaeon]
MIDFNSLESVLGAVSGGGYFFIFVLMIFAGVVITTVAAFAASLGYMNFFVIVLLSFLAECFASTLFYSLGYFGRRRLIGDNGSFLGVKVKSLYKLESHFERHFTKTFLFVKMTPFLSFPGLTLAGVSHVPPRKYFSLSFSIAVLKSIVFSVVGFLLGLVARSFLEDKPLGITIFVLVILMIFLTWLGKLLLQKLLKQDLSLDSIKFFGFNVFRMGRRSANSIKTRVKNSRFVNKFRK